MFLIKEACTIILIFHDIFVLDPHLSGTHCLVTHIASIDTVCTTARDITTNIKAFMEYVHLETVSESIRGCVWKDS